MCASDRTTETDGRGIALGVGEPHLGAVEHHADAIETKTTPIPVTRTIAEPDLDNCPVGFLFRGNSPDWDKEERYFAGMEAPLNHPFWSSEACFHVIEDIEGKALEHIAKNETLIITGDRALTDHQVEARVRQFIPGALPNMDDEYCTVARNGLVFRFQDLRRYYQLCLEGYDRVVLYRREDGDRKVLGERRLPLDPTRYHHLIAQVQGNCIRCYCDGELIVDVTDDAYAEGAAGIRLNSISRFQGIRVATWEQGHQTYLARLDKKSKQLQEMRDSVPRPVLWKRFGMDRLREGRAHFFRPQDEGPVRLLVVSRSESFKGYSLYDLDGDLLWESPTKGEGPDKYKFQFADMDGDGIKEIVNFCDGGIAIHNSTDGQQIAQAPWPESGPFDRNQERAYITHLYPADLGGVGHCDSVVLKDDGSAGGWTFWVLDADLNMRWSRTVQLPPMGHNINVHDINGDGREEILAGYHCYDGDGELVWRVEAARYWDIVNGARHPDSLIAGELWPGTMRVAYVSGGEGFVLVDATNGEVLARRTIGHAQGIAVAKFDKDIPGHQILVATRHQNYGILCFFDGNANPIGRFQPDYLSQGGPTVNWTGDGTEYVLLATSNQVFGCWDMHGNHVIDLKELDMFCGVPPDQRNAPVCLPGDITGDARDELSLQYDGGLFVYTQDRAHEGERIYAPLRNERIIYPARSFERWLTK